MKVLGFLLIVQILSESCPSDKCWYKIGPIGACDLRTNMQCAALECGQSEMTIWFNSELYGLQPEDIEANPFTHPLDHCKPVWDNDTQQWKFSSKLGDCGILIESETVDSER